MYEGRDEAQDAPARSSAAAELGSRPRRARDPVAENRLFAELAGLLADATDQVLARVVQAALELTGAGSAGISVPDPSSGQDRLRWSATAGELAPDAGRTFARGSSPCGLVLERRAAQLFTDPVRSFDALAELRSPVVEMLSVPLRRRGGALGTLWVMAHSPSQRFDAEDERILGSLSSFAAAALLQHAAEAAQGERPLVGGGPRALVLDTVLSSIVDFAYAFDLEGRFLYVNQRLLDLWGLRLEEAVGKTFFELPYPPELAAKLQRQIQTVIRTRRELTDETSYTSPSGATGFYEYIFAPVLRRDGSVEMVAGSTRDVTERKQVAAELAEARRRLASSMMAGEVGAFEWDILRDRLFGDIHFERIFDVALDADGTAPLAAFAAAIHAEDRDRVLALLERSLRTGCDYEAEYRVLARGRERWLIARGKVEHDDEARAVRMPGVVLDITDRKQAQHERELLSREHERQSRLYDTILSTTDDFAYIFDRQARFQFANRRLLEVWDKTLEQVIGKSCLELGYPDWHAAMHEREVREVIATKRFIRGEVPFTGDSGISGVYDYIFTPVLGPDGEVEAIAGTTRDVTERKAAEEERERLLGTLENERARLRAVIEQAPAFICTLRGPDLVFELANERYYETVGERDLIGKPLREALPEIEGQGFFEILERVLSTGETFIGNELPVLLRRKGDGTLDRRVMNLVYQALREADGSISGIFVHGIDVTDAAATRESLRASELRLRRAAADAEAANTAKDQFLAILSHELRTPLTPVAMMATAMESDPRLHAELRDDVAMIRRNVELETRLIDDLLDLSRVVSGKLRLDPQPTHVHRLVHHVIETVGPELHERRITLELELEAESDHVDADPARLQQTLWNLLKNVAKFTPEGGRAVLRTASTSGELVLEVSDWGVGMSAEVLARIFEPFEQGPADTTAGNVGLGLGLAITRAIVEMHGGSIHAASAGEGQGSTFTVRLPLSSAAPSAMPVAEPDASAAPERLRLLLVEDHDDTATTLARLLCIHGMEVQRAATIAEALELATRETFDVIVSDLGLPDGSGVDFLRELREKSAVPAIAMSGYGMEEDLRQTRLVGFAEHLVKPFTLTALREAIRRVASGG